MKDITYPPPPTIHLCFRHGFHFDERFGCYACSMLAKDGKRNGIDITDEIVFLSRWNKKAEPHVMEYYKTRKPMQEDSKQEKVVVEEAKKPAPVVVARRIVAHSCGTLGLCYEC